MLANKIFNVLFSGLLIIAGTASGQESSSQYSQVSSTRYQDQDDEKTALTDELEKLKLRLQELENDVEKKLGGSGDENSSTKLDERIEKIEENVEKQSEAIDDIEGASAGYLHHSHKSPKMSFFGRIHLDYWAFPEAGPDIEAIEGRNPEDRFNFRRLRIGIKGDLNDNMFYKYEGEFAGGEASSYRDAYIGFKHAPLFNTVIIGNHKRPYGLDHLNSSRFNVFIERPFIVEAFNQDSRRLGASSNGFTEDERLNWRFGVWNQELTQTRSGYIGDHYQLEIAARLAGTPWYDEESGGRGYFHWGLAGSVGWPDGTGANNQARYRTRPEARSSARWLDTGQILGADSNMLLGLEGVWNFGSTQIVTEFMRSNVDRLDGIGPDVQFHGGYIQIAHFLTGEYMPWDRKKGVQGRIKPLENFFSVRDCDCNVQRGWGAWQVSARYSYADLTDSDILGGDASSLTMGLNWYWNSHARVQLNYIFGDITRPGIGADEYQIFGARMMVDF